MFVVSYRIENKGIIEELAKYLDKNGGSQILKSQISISLNKNDLSLEEIIRLLYYFLKTIKFSKNDIIEVYYEENSSFGICRLKKNGNKKVSPFDCRL